MSFFPLKFYMFPFVYIFFFFYQCFCDCDILQKMILNVVLKYFSRCKRRYKRYCSQLLKIQIVLEKVLLSLYSIYKHLPYVYLHFRKYIQTFCLFFVIFVLLNHFTFCVFLNMTNLFVVEVLSFLKKIRNVDVILVNWRLNVKKIRYIYMLCFI